MIYLWDTTTGNEIGRLESNGVAALNFNGDGRVLFSAGVKAISVQIWPVDGQDLQDQASRLISRDPPQFTGAGCGGMGQIINGEPVTQLKEDFTMPPIHRGDLVYVAYQPGDQPNFLRTWPDVDPRNLLGTTPEARPWSSSQLPR
ncbi:MAG: hypothetical protein HZY76_12190 [Anaerolineae bacterium]|nr:MAG: hypothetical protein HZY76_12190 [Anaerolineae bacterium]